MYQCLNQSVTTLKGIGPAREQELASQGIHTLKDILLCLPRRFNLRPVPGPMDALEEGAAGAAAGVVEKSLVSGRGRRRNLRVMVGETGAGKSDHQVELVLFGRGYLKSSFKKGRTVTFQGKVTENQGRLQLLSPDYHLEGDPGQGFPGLIPVYSLPSGLFPRTFHRMIDSILEQLAEEPILDWRQEAGLPDRDFMKLKDAMRYIHRPTSLEQAEAARLRIAYEEFFAFQLGLTLKRRARAAEQARLGGQRSIPPEADALYNKCLPFELTASQTRVQGEIREDLASPVSMHRLLQGDVGSGKTVVALYPLLAGVLTGGQSAFMAPTEVLAGQHHQVLESLLEPIGMKSTLVQAGLSAGALRSLLEDPSASIFVGTHALIQERVAFRDLRVCVIDEQHKFGVRQRWNLKAKGREPDVLVMTATPIPRSLALTLYGELDVSVLDGMPPGRTPVETRAVSSLEEEGLTAWLDEEIATGGRAFFVCPLIMESQKIDLQAAVELHGRLKKLYASRCRIGLLHGGMPALEKARALGAFRNGEHQFLVTTVVIEVGVDVPEATTVVILDAWRFGLAQLHQIRGRVGRGARPSRCYLVGEAPTDAAKRRIRIIETTSDGFRIAEEDLKMRGPGEVLGLKQHGLPALKAGDYLSDISLMTLARDDARLLTLSRTKTLKGEILFPIADKDGAWIG